MFDLHNERCEAKKRGFTVCGCIGPGREREKRKKREGRGFVSGPVGGRLACLCPGSLV